MKLLIFTFLLSILAASCGTLHSTTYINPKDSFVLGNNEHGAFKVKMRNDSKYNLEIHHAPIDGGSYSPQTILPDQSAVVRVVKNTALIIANASVDTAAVSLVVRGDTGLSMGYQH